MQNGGLGQDRVRGPGRDPSPVCAGTWACDNSGNPASVMLMAGRSFDLDGKCGI